MPAYFSDNDCVLCNCEEIPVGEGSCGHLRGMNEEKIRDLAIVYRDLQTCNLAEYGAKGFYNVWCTMENIINHICYLMENTSTPDLSSYLTKAEAKETYQVKLKAGDGISISSDGTVTNTKPAIQYKAGTNIRIIGDTISATVPTPKEVDLSGYVKKADYDKVLNALNKIIANLTASGAWQGGIDGNFVANRNIATGNINVFGGTPDGSFFIRTNNGRTENDLAGGI